MVTQDNAKPELLYFWHSQLKTNLYKLHNVQYY